MQLYLLRGCPFAHRVTFLLQEKGLAFEPVFFEHGKRPPELEALGPRAKSPTLFDGDARVWDSPIVLEYLEDRYPEPARLPRDAAGRAEVRMIASWIDAELAAKVEAAEASVAAEMEPWDARLANRDYLVGGGLSLADITLFTLVAAAERGAGGKVPEALPHLRAWYARLAARPTSGILAT